MDISQRSFGLSNNHRILSDFAITTVLLQIKWCGLMIDEDEAMINVIIYIKRLEYIKDRNSMPSLRPYPF